MEMYILLAIEKSRRQLLRLVQRESDTNVYSYEALHRWHTLPSIVMMSDPDGVLGYDCACLNSPS